MDPLNIIAKPLPALKSISDRIKQEIFIKKRSVHSSQVKGLVSEYLAADYFLRQGWRLLSHRKRYAGVEIDLVLESERLGIMLVEVKTMTDMWADSPRFRFAQRWRFVRALSVFYNHQGKEITATIAVVSQKPTQIHLLGDFL